MPESASSEFLPRIVGISRALEWFYSGKMLGAEEALMDAAHALALEFY